MPKNASFFEKAEKIAATLWRSPPPPADLRLLGAFPPNPKLLLPLKISETFEYYSNFLASLKLRRTVLSHSDS